MRLMERSALLGRQSSAETASGAEEPPTKRSRLTSVGLEDLSYPPSRDELKAYEDIPLEKLPAPYKREDDDRVFCNRNLELCDIKFYGFDMDYTLAVYKVSQATFALRQGWLLSGWLPSLAFGLVDQCELSKALWAFFTSFLVPSH